MYPWLISPYPNLVQKIDEVLTRVRSTDDRPYWFGAITRETSGNDWPYWIGRMETGDGVGKAPEVPSNPNPSDPINNDSEIKELLTQIRDDQRSQTVSLAEGLAAIRQAVKDGIKVKF